MTSTPGTAQRVQALMLAACLTSCATMPDIGQPIDKSNTDYGYRYSRIDAVRRRDDILMMVSFSGGGTRAAAFSFGVLRQLASDVVTHDGARTRLIDEVDFVSAVSGGGITAAAYALYGDQVFTELPARFLYRNLNRSLWLALLNPVNLIRMGSSRFARGDLFAEVLDRRLFGGATFANLIATPGRPFLVLNATDLSTTARVEFTQARFDAFCLDLTPVRVARAVVASGSTPLASTPITFRNFGGRCNYRAPQPVASAGDIVSAARQENLAYEDRIYQTDLVKFLHLADGALSDNLGVRTAIDTITAMESMEQGASFLGIALPRKIVFVLVNAANQPGLAIARQARAPDEMQTARLAAAAAIDRYAAENNLLLRQMLTDLTKKLSSGTPTELYWIEVDPHFLTDDSRRDAVLRLPTNLKLKAPVVDHLICSAQEILARSADYQRLLHDLGSMAPLVPACQASAH
jgi:NTE family protein